ncbi:MAG: BlaI/MecI/CopY family transcriptional regulator [Actinomycetota bacterium]|nr:BlaI/MecI/CopY family transcriptional regulator [Actinomycetota bacterium]
MAKLAMGELEAAVMDVLWDAAGPLTPGQVHVVLSGERSLAYTTVMTILVRLWQKGRLGREQHGRAYAYRPVQSREAYAASRMDEVLGDTKDRRLALSYFIAGLKPGDRARLRGLLGARGEQG